MGAKEQASQRLTLLAFCAYIGLALFTCIATYFAQSERTDAPPVECTQAPEDCPVRTFCYRKIDASTFGEELYNVTDSNGVAIWDRDAIEADDGLIRYVCACYALYGEGGQQPLPGGPAGSFCEEDEPYKAVCLAACYVCLAITCFSVFNQYLTMYQLYKAEALMFNASGITMILCAIAATMESWLIIVYTVELQGLASPSYSFNDGIRPAVFGFFAVAEMGALLEVSVMWADVYTKSAKMGAESGKVDKLKKAVAALIFTSFFVVMLGMLTGLTMVAGAWAGMVLIGISVAYKKGGYKLSQLLMPSDPNAPGASSAKGAAQQILFTSKAIPWINAVFILFLGAHFVTVQRPATKSLSMICVFGFLIMAVVHQIRLLYYVKFGNRKKLAKAGYAGFRSSLMSTMTTSTVAPDDSSASTTVSSNTSSE
ncbi:hypothetical protein TrST_g13647 [Triparma strigata]|uniref:Transmembrane protein n=1 Tax=Triparma strigata TaxID=1606541 RepID=A0A9W7EPZ5_9STRA|nr:hypothetical protein TrST_g13647 [Triparma strigata]